MHAIHIGLFTLITFFAWEGRANAYGCEKSCKDHCTAGWLGNNPNPSCMVACKLDHAANCSSVSAKSFSGEIGAQAYPAAASYAASNNSHSRVMRSREKEALSEYFSYSLMNRVRIYFNATLLEKWGDGPYAIRFTHSAAQTFGYNIYVTSGEYDDFNSWIILLGHELTHTQQYVDRGESLSRFGRDYFEGFYDAGFSYKFNPMEVEAWQKERAFAVAVDRYKVRTGAPYNLRFCNKSKDKIYVAIARQHELDGFSLTPIVTSKGWWGIDVGDCKTVLTNQPRGLPVWFAAMNNTDGDEGGVYWRGGRKFCIHRRDRFEINGYESCDGTGQYSYGFVQVSEPSGSHDTLSYDLTRINRKLRICNKSSQGLYLAMIRGDYTPLIRGWRNKGWWSMESDTCRTFAFGDSSSKVYLYGDGYDSAQWTGDSGINICTYGKAFQTFDDVPCSGDLHEAIEVRLNTSGTKTFNFTD